SNTHYAVSYAYYLDSLPITSRGAGGMVNTLASKSLTYNEVWDNVSTSYTEPSTIYQFQPTTSKITHPDGTSTSYYFFFPGQDIARGGLVYETINPDQSKTEVLWAQNLTNTSAPTLFVNPYMQLEAYTTPSGASSRGTAHAIDSNGNPLTVS